MRLDHDDLTMLISAMHMVRDDASDRLNDPLDITAADDLKRSVRLLVELEQLDDMELLNEGI